MRVASGDSSYRIDQNLRYLIGAWPSLVPEPGEPSHIVAFGFKVSACLHTVDNDYNFQNEKVVQESLVICMLTRNILRAVHHFKQRSRKN